jgi:hypothetical protein
MTRNNRQVRVLFSTKEPQSCARTVARQAPDMDKSKSNNAIFYAVCYLQKKFGFPMDVIFKIRNEFQILQSTNVDIKNYEFI